MPTSKQAAEESPLMAVDFEGATATESASIAEAAAIPENAADAPQPKRSIARALGAAVVIVALIAVGISAGTFVMSPYGSKSQVVWSEFRQTDDIDTVCLGSSLAAHAYDPTVVDATCGTESFNMSTPQQETAESYLGLKEAIEHHDIKRVVYGVDYAAFVGEPNLYPARVFENEKWKGDPFFERFSDLAYLLDGTDWLFDERSINWLFPWTEQQPTGGASGIVRNVRMQLDGTTLVAAAEANEEGGWRYFGRGYGNDSQVLDYNDGMQEDFARVAQFDKQQLSERKLAGLADMAQLCADNDIEFVAFVPALPDFSLIGLHDYYDKLSSRVRETVEAHGGIFYDFNVAAPEFYQAQENHFEDYQHYNTDGGRAFSEAFAQLLAAREAGLDTSSWFTTYDERLAGIDHISAVRLHTHRLQGGTHGERVEARCFTGTNVQVEYRFFAKAADAADFELVRDWSSEATIDFTPEQPGRYTLRVEARQVGADVPERWVEGTVRI